MTRREWLACALGAGPIALAKPPRLTPAIDTHIHLFDTRRAQGVPWPPKDDRVLYRPALPPRYRKVIAGLGVVGAIEVECSPWFEDNQGLHSTSIAPTTPSPARSEEHTSELQSRGHLVCLLLLEKKNTKTYI